MRYRSHELGNVKLGFAIDKWVDNRENFSKESGETLSWEIQLVALPCSFPTVARIHQSWIRKLTPERASHFPSLSLL